LPIRVEWEDIPKNPAMAVVMSKLDAVKTNCLRDYKLAKKRSGSC
jgi:hypothetical protein